MRWPRWLGGASASSDRYVDDWLRGLERGISTATGIQVTVENAVSVAGIAACVQVQADDLAKVPLELKRRTDTGFEPAVEHPLYALLKYGPAPWLSAFAWRSAQIAGMLTHGNHYSRIRRAFGGRIDRIVPIQAGKTRARWTDEGEPFFDISARAVTEAGVPWWEIVHAAYRGSDMGGENGGVTGKSPILQHKESVALMIAAEKFAGLFYANGGHPSIVLEYDKKLPNQDVANNLRAAVERVYGGLDNKWKIAILEYGIKVRELSGDPAKSQLIETRKHNAELACTMYRTPPHKIGLLERATNNNIEHQSIDYVTGPLSALAKSIETAIETACLTPDERAIYKVEHNLEGLMRGDILSRYRAHAIGRQWGWLTVNEVRRTENQNGIGPSGDEYLTPLNMAPAGDAAPGDNQRDRGVSTLIDPDRPDVPAVGLLDTFGRPLMVH